MPARVAITVMRAGTFVATIAVISGIGALNGWTLVTAEIARAASQDNLFPFPKVFARTDHKDTAWISVLIAAILPSLLLLWSYNTSSGLKVFTYLVDLTVVTVAIPYLFSACAQLSYLVSRRRQVHGALLAGARSDGRGRPGSEQHDRQFAPAAAGTPACRGCRRRSAGTGEPPEGPSLHVAAGPLLGAIPGGWP